MAQASITITINTPVNITAAKALQLFTDQRGYNPDSGENRNAFAKRVLAEEVKRDIRARREYEDKLAVVTPDDITVD